MRKTFAPGAGGVVSADIAVPEHEREVAFYSKILTTGENPLWREDLMNNQGTPVIGLGERIPEYESLPLQWMPHIQVKDVTASAKRALELGGKEVMMDEQGQWACLTDPSGAAFGLIPEVPADGVDSGSDSIGKISWLSLATQDASNTKAFYEDVIGWTAKSVETDSSSGAKFEMFRTDESAAAEIYQTDGEGAEFPLVWLMHLPVGDLGESLRLVAEHGGQVLRKDADSGYAAIRDPVGVSFALQAAPQ